jgi:hypothetical protein
MILKSLVAIAGLSMLPLIGAIPPATAQTPTAPIAQPSAPTSAPPRHVRRRIEINPRPLLYRRCTDWYELQYRPSGTVLYPQMRCWWVRG